MRRWLRVILVLVLVHDFIPWASAQSRGIRVEPLRDSDRSAEGISVDGSAGLFIGVGVFPNGTDSGLSPLKYAVDDAIALAHLFILELKLIPSTNSVLALSGRPMSQRGKDQLKRLTDSGLRVSPADHSNLIRAVVTVTEKASRDDGLVVVSVATHGFEEQGSSEQYLAPSNVNRKALPETSLSAKFLKTQLQKSLARKRILLLDACREVVNGGTRGSLMASAGWQESFRNAQGFAVLGSCSKGQLSWESGVLEQGVFTHYFLKACQGELRTSSQDGLIRLGDVAQWAALETGNWVKENRGPSQQEPWTEGEEAARRIPLAVDRDVLSLNSEVEEAKKIAYGAHVQFKARFSNGQFDAVEAVLNGRDVDKIQAVVRRIRRDLGKGSLKVEDLEDFLGWWSNNMVKSPADRSSATNRSAIKAVPTDSSKSGDGLVLVPSSTGTWTNSIGSTLVHVSKGNFIFGGDRGDFEERPATRVTLTRAFWIGKYEITQAEWNAVMDVNPSDIKGDRLPVVRVTWQECQSFCNKLTERERMAGKLANGAEYGLPTEAEWEYSCRSGTTGRWFHGDAEPGLAEHAWYLANSRSRLQEVGTKKPNAWGLHDLHGNAAEWVMDWYGKYPGGEVNDPQGVRIGSNRVIRGGSWLDASGYCRSGVRGRNGQAARLNTLGFRLVLRDSSSGR
jgi:formylglycine-generating enzyme required for sulfatase activity/uncharacterized caspase-like protein